MRHYRYQLKLPDLDLRLVLWERVLLLELQRWLDFGVSRVERPQPQANELDIVSFVTPASGIALLTSE